LTNVEKGDSKMEEIRLVNARNFCKAIASGTSSPMTEDEHLPNFSMQLNTNSRDEKSKFGKTTAV
jgi:hypothetical protein